MRKKPNGKNDEANFRIRNQNVDIGIAIRCIFNATNVRYFFNEILPIIPHERDYFCITSNRKKYEMIGIYT